MADVTEEDIVKMRLLFDGDGLGRTFYYFEGTVTVRRATKH